MNNRLDKYQEGIEIDCIKEMQFFFHYIIKNC